MQRLERDPAVRMIERGFEFRQALRRRLATTERTVKFHRAHIMTKMEAGSLPELVRMAGQLGVALPSRAGPVPKDTVPKDS